MLGADVESWIAYDAPISMDCTKSSDGEEERSDDAELGRDLTGVEGG